MAAQALTDQIWLPAALQETVLHWPAYLGTTSSCDKCYLALMTKPTSQAGPYHQPRTAGHRGSGNERQAARRDDERALTWTKEPSPA